MKTRRLITFFSAALLGLSAVPANAAILLDDFGFNINGVKTYNDLSVASSSAFDTITGLGSISFTISGATNHTFDAIFDHEIDESGNSFFNENGSATGTASAGQSWEIDEPGFGTSNGTGGVPYFGDIYPNFEDHLLDNQVFFDATDNQSFLGNDDVAMAMGWDFTLGSNETALITLNLSQVAPTSGFFLTQFDVDDIDEDERIYFSSTLTISAIPEPSVILLMGMGFAGLAVMRRRA